MATRLILDSYVFHEQRFRTSKLGIKHCQVKPRTLWLNYVKLMVVSHALYRDSLFCEREIRPSGPPSFVSLSCLVSCTVFVSLYPVSSFPFLDTSIHSIHLLIRSVLIGFSIVCVFFPKTYHSREPPSTINKPPKQLST